MALPDGQFSKETSEWTAMEAHLAISMRTAEWLRPGSPGDIIVHSGDTTAFALSAG